MEIARERGGREGRGRGREVGKRRNSKDVVGLLFLIVLDRK